MNFIDTHCHIHESSYPLDRQEVINRAVQAGVTKMICVGTDEKSSEEAVEFAARHDGIYASIGVHPHETKDGWGKIIALAETAGPADASAPENFSDKLKTFSGAAPRVVTRANDESSYSFITANKHLQPELKATSGPDFKPGAKPLASGDGRISERSKLVAVGEIGLDYFYTHSPRDVQIKALEAQIDVALRYDLPVIFHVREAFEDFWPVFDNFHGIRGELHSFTDSAENLEQGLKRGLYIGVNGISTFTKVEQQRAIFASIPLDRLLLETDAPFLTPVPFRGKVNEPAFVRQIAEFHAGIRGVSTEQIADASTANAQALFNLS